MSDGKTRFLLAVGRVVRIGGLQELELYPARSDTALALDGAPGGGALAPDVDGNVGTGGPGSSPGVATTPGMVPSSWREELLSSLRARIAEWDEALAYTDRRDGCILDKTLARGSEFIVGPW